MAHQEEGWPLGLHLVNVRVGLGGRARDYFGSISFNTMFTASSNSSADFSSDLDTESTGSFFHERSMTLGTLMGTRNVLELSRRSMRGRRTSEPLKSKKSLKSRTWFLSLCSKDSTDVKDPKDQPSLGHFLAVERRIRRSNAYDNSVGDVEHSSSLFLNGHIAPPPKLHSTEDGGSGCGREGSDHGMFPCVCGQVSN